MIGKKVYVQISRVSLDKIDDFFMEETIDPDRIDNLKENMYASGEVIALRHDSYMDSCLVKFEDETIEAFPLKDLYFTEDTDVKGSR